MRFLNANYLRGVGIFGIVLTVSLQAQAQSNDEAALSQALYNIKGGQTVLVDASSNLGQMPEAVTTDDKKLLKEQEVWALQSLVPPDGLARAQDGPLVGENITDRAGNTVGYTESILIDPATGLVHYLVGSGGQIGNDRYVPVPVSAVDLEKMEIWAAGSDVQTLEWYSSSDLEQKFPSQPINKEIRAVEPALIPTTALAK